jgi:hypothetical protein
MIGLTREHVRKAPVMSHRPKSRLRNRLTPLTEKPSKPSGRPLTGKLNFGLERRDDQRYGSPLINRDPYPQMLAT